MKLRLRKLSKISLPSNLIKLILIMIILFFLVLGTSNLKLKIKSSFYTEYLKSNEFDLQKINKIVKNKGYKITNIFPRKVKLYTQGIFFDESGEYFYESGGKYKLSTINKFKYPSMEPLNSFRLEDKYFAEGIAKCGKYIFQLTWKENEILKFSENLEFLGKIEINPPRQGWGLSAFKDDLLISTDGSDKIYVLDCTNSLRVIDIIKVKYNDFGISKLNDLIFVEDFIYLNRYYDNKILKVDYKTGNVIKSFDMKPLMDYEFEKNEINNDSYNHGCVLNGIGYNPFSKKFLLTGKHWGFYYEIDLF